MKKVLTYELMSSVEKDITGSSDNQIIGFIDPENNSRERTSRYQEIYYDFIEDKFKTHFTLAAAFPLFFGVASAVQAGHVADVLREKFLKPGGLTTTCEFTGQQWDAPNGWAPLQWITYKGLLHYGLEELASQIKTRWTTVNLKVYEKTGKMTEKYDVWNEDGDASGGEYPNQDGFGWTNGVFLAMQG